MNKWKRINVTIKPILCVFHIEAKCVQQRLYACINHQACDDVMKLDIGGIAYKEMRIRWWYVNKLGMLLFEAKFFGTFLRHGYCCTYSEMCQLLINEFYSLPYQNMNQSTNIKQRKIIIGECSAILKHYHCAIKTKL
jgi:hypothetical protein